jgi:hypothetical protein
MVEQRTSGHTVSRLSVHIVWSTGNITDEMVNQYLEHHRRPDSGDNNNFIIEPMTLAGDF